jgi:hypothetical protein
MLCRAKTSSVSQVGLDAPTDSVLFSFTGGVSFCSGVSAPEVLDSEPKVTPPSLVYTPSDLTSLTTANGSPIGDPQALTAGPRGPLLMQDVQLVEQMQHFNRERSPERVVHAKGSGAYGTFTVTNDLTRYTKAKLFAQVSEQTEVVARFSTAAGERGAADAERDVPGFAVKFCAFTGCSRRTRRGGRR